MLVKSKEETQYFFLPAVEAYLSSAASESIGHGAEAEGTQFSRVKELKEEPSVSPLKLPHGSSCFFPPELSSTDNFAKEGE